MNCVPDWFAYAEDHMKDQVPVFVAESDLTLFVIYHMNVVYKTCLR